MRESCEDSLKEEENQNQNRFRLQECGRAAENAIKVDSLWLIQAQLM